MIKKAVVTSILTLGLVSFAYASNNITYYGIPNGDQKINSINFNDVLSQGEGYWAKSAIYQISSLDIMQGMANGVFSPTTKVTNEQAITTVLNSMGKATEVNDQKVISNYWSDKYIKYGIKNGLITGKTVMRLSEIAGNLDTMKKKGVYVRDAAITREEMAELISKAFSLSSTSTDGKKPLEFMDSNQIDTTQKSYVDAVSMNGIMVGSDDNMFNPKSGLTRAELAQILKNCESYILTNVGVTEHTGFIENVGTGSILISDENGDSITVDLTGKNIPTLRNNILTGTYSLKSSDEIEYYVDAKKNVKFIRVTDASIYGEEQEEQEKNQKQGIVTGNSPYFYEIAIKDKNGNVEKYTYGRWTEIYKDGKETSASSIMQGDTVYLEFDNLGDLVVIRGVTNAVISYATVTEISGTKVTMVPDDGKTEKYDLNNVPIYKNGEEISVDNLHNGEYAKLSLSQNKLIKVEIVVDERSCEAIYKGYISDINLIQDRIIIRNPSQLKDGKWTKLTDNFITLPLDRNMQISYEGINMAKNELGEKQVGKFAYIATRKDTEVLEKVKAMNIGIKGKEEVITGEVSKFNESTGELRISGNSIKPYVDENTVLVINNKIVTKADFSKGDNLAVVVSKDDNGDYIAKLITTIDEVDSESRDVYAYFGKVKSIDEGNEVIMNISARYEDEEWIIGKERNASFVITPSTRIFNETEPLNFDEFNKEYKGKEICIVAYGDEAVIITVVSLTDTPYIFMGSVDDVETDKFTVTDVEIYDLENEEWTESTKEEVSTLVNTAITKNGKYVKSSDIKYGQEAVVIKPDEQSSAAVVLLND